MKMSEDERQCLSESRGGSANVISIFSYCARRYCSNVLISLKCDKNPRKFIFSPNLRTFDSNVIFLSLSGRKLLFFTGQMI